MTYSKNIVRLRQESIVTGEEVADAIGVTPAAVCGWERGNKQMSIANLICLADFFAVSTDEILGRRSK